MAPAAVIVGAGVGGLLNAGFDWVMEPVGMSFGSWSWPGDLIPC